MQILVVDGQGGGIGKCLIEKLRQAIPQVQIIAVGTNSIATSAMLKAGADVGATGENPAIFNAQSADIIAGPIGIILANAMWGEITPTMAMAITGSTAQKVLIPVEKCRVHIAGHIENTLSKYIEEAVLTIQSFV